MYVSDDCKELIKYFQKLGYKHQTWEVFQDWLLMFSIAVSNTVDWGQKEEREKLYLDTIGKYDKEEQKLFTELSGAFINAMQRASETEGPTDILGKLFHSLELHNKYHGRFFTPFHICEFMGQVSLGDGGEAGNIISNNLNSKGYITLCEPAVGSGAMVLGFAKAMYKNKLNYCKQLCVTACDIDIKCVHMAYLQLSLFGIPAVIIHGNSLTLEEWSKWYTPAYMFDMWPLKFKANSISDIPAQEPSRKDVENQDEPKITINKNGQLSFF